MWGSLGSGGRSHNSGDTIIKAIVPAVIAIGVSLIPMKAIVSPIGVSISTIGVSVRVGVGTIEAAIEAVVPGVVEAVRVDGLGFCWGGLRGSGGGVGGCGYQTGGVGGGIESLHVVVETVGSTSGGG